MGGGGAVLLAIQEPNCYFRSGFINTFSSLFSEGMAQIRLFFLPCEIKRCQAILQKFMETCLLNNELEPIKGRCKNGYVLRTLN